MGPELPANPMQPGPHRADRNVKRLGDFVAVKAGPGDQEQHVPIGLRQLSDPQCEPTDPRLRVHLVRDDIPRIGSRRVCGGGPCGGRQFPEFLPEMPA